jgi:hypothetical protein
MATPIVDLATINPPTEIVVRAGNTKAPEARTNLQEAYVQRDVVRYPDAPGISTCFGWEQP